MTVLAPPPQTRVIGYAQVGGQRVPVSVDAAWFIYLTQSLYRRVGGAVSPSVDELDASRFEDAGITKRGLDFAGKSNGADGAQMAQMVKGMVPILLAQAKLGAIQNEISAAVNTYIDDPKALTIAAAPANPVAFPMIMGAAMGAPETIPGLIGLKVTAND